MLPLFALHFLLWVKVVNSCLTLGYNSVDKIVRIIVIARQKIGRKIKLCPFYDHWSTFAATFLPKPKMLVSIYYTAPILLPTWLVMLGRPRHLSHITMMCMTLTFSSAVASLGGQIVHHSQRSLYPSLSLLPISFTVP